MSEITRWAGIGKGPLNTHLHRWRCPRLGETANIAFPAYGCGGTDPLQTIGASDKLVRMTAEKPIDRYLTPGTKVRYDCLMNGVTPSAEYGVVVHCCLSEELGGLHDCVVAFFGNDPPPTGQPNEKPYILRYAALSLTVVETWPV